MEFCDSTGHIFSLQDYSSYPQGYEYNENEYIFWFEAEYNTKLSVDCYYIKPIRILLDGTYNSTNTVNISISNSNHYRLLSSNTIQNCIENNSNIFLKNEYLTLDETKDFVKELNTSHLSFINEVATTYIYIDEHNNKYNYYGDVIEKKQTDNTYKYYGELYMYTIDDNIYYASKNDVQIDEYTNTANIIINNEIIQCIKIDKEIELTKEENYYTLIPFYVVGNVSEEGTWLTNVLINVDNKQYCPITVGGSFYNEQEELKINAENMGIFLPKDIIKTFYDKSFYDENIDMALWNSKIKEYLMNYMKIYGERGNFRNILLSLKWFGYGDKIEISKLLKTDNEFIEQYINDQFSVYNDMLNNYLLFKNTTYITLSLKGICYSQDEYDQYNFNDVFWGEAKPKLIDLFSTCVNKKIDETDIEYIVPYYDFCFNELGLKLSALQYYFEKYFLPLHIKIFRTSITNQCFSSDIKMLSTVSQHITANSVCLEDTSVLINFPINDTIWVSTQTHYIDDNFNEFNNYIKRDDKILNNIYYLNDICFSIPIDFSSKTNGEKYYNVNMLLFRNDERIFETSFNFTNNVKFYYIDSENNTIYINNKDVFIETDNFTSINKYYTYIKSNKIELTREVTGYDYSSFVVYPKLISENTNIYNWLDSKYTLMMYVNNKWYSYKFTIKLPELSINVGTLKYVYNYNMFKQFSGIKNNILQFNAKMYTPDIVTISNIDFTGQLVKYMKNNYIKCISDKFMVLTDSIYYYYINKHNCKCIFNIHVDDDNNTHYYILTNDSKYDDYVTEYKHTECIIDDFILFEITNNMEEQLNEFKSYINIENNTYKNVYSSISKNINSFIDTYKTNLYLSNNISHLMNDVHLFYLVHLDENYNKNYIKYNLTESGNNILSINIEDNNTVKELKFADNDSVTIIDIYSKFFDINTGDINCEIYYNDILTNTWLKTNTLFENNDLYLMHDDEYWYIVMISKHPNNVTPKLYSTYKINNNSNLYLEYVRSDKKILFNRLQFESTNGINKFNKNDVIACKLETMNNIPFNLLFGSKWIVKPLSIGINNEIDIKSPNNTCILSNGNNINYDSGYYEIYVNYALDNKSNIMQKKSTKILIQ